MATVILTADFYERHYTLHLVFCQLNFTKYGIRQPPIRPNGLANRQLA